MPKNISPPTLAKIPVIGQTLMSSAGRWTFRPTLYSCHWQECANQTCWARISDATSKSYTVRANDFGERSHAEVTACNARGYSSAFSPLRHAVIGADPFVEQLTSTVVLALLAANAEHRTDWMPVGEGIEIWRVA